MEIIFVSASRQLLEVAKAEGFHTIDAAKVEAAPAKEEKAVEPDEEAESTNVASVDVDQ
jgi:methionine salvage enolase-phosphatase E1